MVKPRKRSSGRRDVIAYDGERIAIERTGQVVGGDSLAETVRREASSLFVCPRAESVLEELHATFNGDPHWQFKLKPVSQEVYRPGRDSLEIHRTIVVFFGFRDTHRNNNYHHCLEPSVFCNSSVRELRPDVNNTLEALLQWGVSVRDWAHAQGINPSASAGGFAAQLLRDARFYPRDRRKVPKATNAKARTALPGNHYSLRIEPGKLTAKATYCDQRGAHHYHAERLAFPSSDGLYASGRFRNCVDKPLPEGNELLGEFGLFYVRLRVPNIPWQKFPPPYAESRGSRLVWLYSNELPYLYGLGCEVEYVVAAYSSPERESGLNEYARWAQSELARVDAVQRRWLKPTLLATYGVLAARPKPLRVGWGWAKSGAKTPFPLNGNVIYAHARVTKRELEPSIANVIHRGMIEAETRCESLKFAQSMVAQGRRVLALYADSVFVGDGPLPLLSPPWEVREQLDNLEFFAPTAFYSQQLQRLPGIPREQREKISRKNSFRALTAARARTKIQA